MEKSSIGADVFHEGLQGENAIAALHGPILPTNTATHHKHALVGGHLKSP